MTPTCRPSNRLRQVTAPLGGHSMRIYAYRQIVSALALSSMRATANMQEDALTIPEAEIAAFVGSPL